MAGSMFCGDSRFCREKLSPSMVRGGGEANVEVEAAFRMDGTSREVFQARSQLLEDGSDGVWLETVCRGVRRRMTAAFSGFRSCDTIPWSNIMFIGVLEDETPSLMFYTCDFVLAVELGFSVLPLTYLSISPPAGGNRCLFRGYPKPRYMSDGCGFCGFRFNEDKIWSCFNRNRSGFSWLILLLSGCLLVCNFGFLGI